MRRREAVLRRVTVRSETDPHYCRTLARGLALDLGFSGGDASAIAIVVSELTANIVRHAGRGTITLRELQEPRGLEVVAADDGPGVPDPARAFEDGISRGRSREEVLLRGEGPPSSLGCGLGAVRRLSDECAIDSGPGRGTTVTARKWLRRA